MKIKKRIFYLISFIAIFLLFHTTDLSLIWLWPWYAEKVNQIYNHYPGLLFINILFIGFVGAVFPNLKQENIVE